MIYGCFRSGERIAIKRSDPTKGFSLFVLSVATSLDALAVGMSLAAIRVAVLYPAAVIGVVAFSMTVVGMKVGPLTGRLVGKWAELAGGLVLIFIGVKILFEHL